MKKILSLSLVALMTLSATAQVQQVSSVEKVHNAILMTKQAVQGKSILSNSDLSLSPRKAVAANDTLAYLRPQGTFFNGLGSGFMAYVNPMIITDTIEYSFPNVSVINSEDTLLWVIAGQNNYNLYYAWDYDNDVPEDYIVFDGIPADYYISTPILATFNKNNELVTSYQLCGEEAIMLSKPNDVYGAIPLTTSPRFDSNGQRNTAIYSYDEKSWLYGTNSSFQYSDTKETFTVDTILVVFDNLSTLWIDSIILPFYTEATELAGVIPAGNEIVFDLLPVIMEPNSYKISSEPLVSLVATQANVTDFTPAEGQYLGMGTIDVALGSANALGGFTPQPITVTGAFSVQVSGFNKGGDIAFPSEKQFSYPTSDTFFRVNGKFMNGFGMNMALSINAMFVDPEEGGETGVENINAVNGVEKVVVDGQVLIRKGDKTYNVLGAEVK